MTLRVLQQLDERSEGRFRLRLYEGADDFWHIVVHDTEGRQGDSVYSFRNSRWDDARAVFDGATAEELDRNARNWPRGWRPD